MKLSVIIVNYNVRYYLEQAVRASQKALITCSGEIIVVDNASSDDSADMMAKEFPGIKYIYLQENIGFSKANNIGIQHARGEYVLLLNPDTVVAEDALAKAVDFMDSHPTAGGLGVHMIDGNGHFLPESKRGLPTPKAAFYKIFGLSSLFPKSKTFGSYHLGYLSKESLHEVDVLSGAFMLMRSKTIEKSGLLDEDFFMYGEDIDLSYRIIQSGFVNYYFPESRIIHYKGESTKKGSINYVFVFYRAMVIFAKKHFDKGQASLFGFLIELAVYFRAGLSLARRAFGNSWQTIIDSIIIFSCFNLAKIQYAEYADKSFNLPLIQPVIIGYTVLAVLGLLYGGAYDLPFKSIRWLKGWLITGLVLLGFYSLLPESYRFSRAVLLIGTFSGFALGYFWRWLLHTTNPSWFLMDQKNEHRVAIVGNADSVEKVLTLCKHQGYDHELVIGISLEMMPHYQVGFAGSIDQLGQAIKDFRLTEVIFDTSVIDNKSMISAMEKTSALAVKFKMAVGNPIFLIGSQEVLVADDRLAVGELTQVNMQAVRRAKRSLDILLCMTTLAATPVLLLFIDDKKGFFTSLLQVSLGRASWVGYDPRGKHPALPKLKPAVTFDMMNVIIPESAQKQLIQRNLRYIKHHVWFRDLAIVLRHLHFLGNPPK